MLAAARCNMYSHALVAYVAELKNFAQKAASTFQTISKALILKPKYDFCVLKELSQNEGGASEEVQPSIEAVDKDQSLFFAVINMRKLSLLNLSKYLSTFQSEYQDKQPKEESQLVGKDSSEEKPSELATACGDNESLLIELSKLQLEDSPLLDATLEEEEPAQNTSTNNKFWARMFNQQSQPLPLPTSAAMPSGGGGTASAAVPSKSQAGNNNPWLDLFADLDPLANPQAFDLKMSGGRSVAEQT